MNVTLTETLRCVTSLATGPVRRLDMLSCVDALEAWPSVLPIATGTALGFTTDGMTTVAATSGVASLDHWSGLFMAGDSERAVRHPGRCYQPGGQRGERDPDRSSALRGGTGNRAPDAVAVSRRCGGPGTGLRGEHRPTAKVTPGGAQS